MSLRAGSVIEFVGTITRNGLVVNERYKVTKLDSIIGDDHWVFLKGGNVDEKWVFAFRSKDFKVIKY